MIALLIASLVLSAIGTGVSIQQQRAASKAAEDQAKYQRQYWEGLKESENRRFEILKAQAEGRARALYAKAGVLPETGTPLEVMGLNALELEKSRRLAEWSIMATGSAREFAAESAAHRLRLSAIGTGFQGGAQLFQTAAIHFGPAGEAATPTMLPTKTTADVPTPVGSPRISH
jgi:hypothetical protein